MKKKFWTLRYILINVTYFAAFCTIHAYAAVFLLDRGFSNTEIGILLAVANVVSAFCQPWIAGMIDKPGPLTNRRFTLFCVSVIGIGALLLLLIPGSKILIFGIYALIYMIQFAYQPVLTALCFEYQKAGADINYGLARGLGSAGFAVTSAIIGGAVNKQGVNLLMTATIVIMLLSGIVVYTFKKPGDTSATPTDTLTVTDSDSGASPVAGNNCDKAPIAHNKITDFARTYPAFMLFLVGTICFFFAHNMINDFMIQIIRFLGGGETELGFANFLQAILELPVMAMIGFILQKTTAKRLMIFSGGAFLVKTLILLFAVSLPMMFVSQSFQLFAYAVFIPASATYVSETMEELDQVKGQAYITSAITLGGVFSNLISGVILDHLGVRIMLTVGSIVCAIGVVIAFFALTRLPEHRRSAEM